MADFLRWVITHLRLDQQPDEQVAAGQGPDRRIPSKQAAGGQVDAPAEIQNTVRLWLSEPDRACFDGQSELVIGFSPSVENSQIESATLESRFGRWLAQKLHAVGPAVPARPRDQPQAVGDFTAALFSAYQVEGGQVHLGGCQLTDFPFLRLSYPAAGDFSVARGFTTAVKSFSPETDSEIPVEAGDICHLFIGPDGSWVPDPMVRDLGLLDLEPIDGLPPRIDETALDALIGAGRRMVTQGISRHEPTAVAADPVAATLIWVKRADGHLRFTIGDASTTLAFSDWARLLKPPPYSCEHSGTTTFHLAATDDGRIDAWDQIACCQRSGQRVLKQELLECSVTGQHVLSQFTEICPVSGESCLSEEFCTCEICRQQVSKAVVDDNNQCAACQQMAKLSKEDPRLVWLHGEHPRLARWNRWKMAETAQVYIAEARGLCKRLLVVADKQTLAVRYLATSGLFSREWKPVPPSEAPEFLD